MSNSPKKKKQRAEKYDPKVSFSGSFEDMIKISTTGAGAKKKEESINKPKPKTSNKK